MRALRVVLPLVVVGAVMLVAVGSVAGNSKQAAFRIQREALRREWVDRSAVARGAAGAPGAEEARAVVAWWFEAWNGLRVRYSGQAAKAEPARRGGGREDEWYRYAEDRVAALRAGYAPIASGVEQGQRLDVLGVQPGEQPDSHERGLRLDFALWGAPRRVERDPTAGDAPNAPQRLVVPVAFRQLAIRFLDAAGKPYGEMTGSGEPYLVLKDPERFSADLPPGLVLGSWWVDAFPREAARAEVTVRVQIQGMTAAALEPTFRWELPVRDEWKLRPGETFRAEVREAAPEASPGKR